MICLFLASFLACLSHDLVLAQKTDDFEAWRQEQSRRFQEFRDRKDDAYRAYVAEVEARWNAFEESTKKKWVDYSPDRNTRSRVKFEDGYVELESVQEADDPNAADKANEGIKDQLMKLVDTDNEARTSILENQIPVDDSEQATVDRTNVETYFDSKVQNQVQPVERLQSQDGKTRIKYRVRVPFVQNHYVRRAEKYLPIVVKYAEQFKLNPRLVLAIIYAESAFNPMAKSHADAYGMMQLIPKYGARDAYQFIYREDRIVDPAALYNPEMNIQLGCGYLHLLLYQHWQAETVWEKKRALSICSYNWGPHNVKSKVYDRFGGDKLSYQALYRRLRAHTPDETSDYLERVLERISYFDPYFME